PAAGGGGPAGALGAREPARPPRGAPRARALRRHRRGARPARDGARAPQPCRPPARHRARDRPQPPPPPLVLPHPQHGAGRLRSARDRDHGAGGARPPQAGPEARRPGASGAAPGRLITVEGIDGSGKSTQLLLLDRWLTARGFPVRFTEWNSSRLVRRAMKRGKRKDLLTPTTFSLLHAVDFADRLTYQIVPPLKAGMIVLADRYVYTAFSRDVARGVHPAWVRAVYSFAPRPDLALYFRVPIEVSLDR